MPPLGICKMKCFIYLMFCIYFFPEKRMKEIFAYVLQFMLTFDEMQITNPLMCQFLDYSSGNGVWTTCFGWV